MSASEKEAVAEHLIGDAEKNANERWRCSLTRFKGHDLAQVRAFVVQGRDGSAVSIPTKNGLTLRLAQIQAIIGLLQKAHAEAVARGLLGSAGNDR